jgi:hypothetical protein
MFEVPVAKIVNCRAQEQAFPTAKSQALTFERPERPHYGAVGLPAPKQAIEIQIGTRQPVAHHSMMAVPCGHLEMSSL